MKSMFHLFVSILAGMLAIAAAPAGASGFLPETVKLTYNVKLYETDLGNLVTTMQRNGDSYEVEAETRAEGLASILLGGILREECSFSVSESFEVKPRYYTIEKEGSDAYSHSAEFLWDDMKVAYEGGRSLDIPLAGYVIDNCTVPYAFAAADQIMLKEYPYIHILGGRNLRHYEDIQVSHETVEVPAGKFETVRIDQQRVGDSDKKLSIWVAPAMQNIAVRIEERRKFRVTTMELSSSEGL
ncbi:MAG: DUF3108 domain-containing protein [Gammaproteobacteria bacterium]|nr:DUF3108 domain-containing protein [Gammaproteobacteria bacterium]